MDKHTEGQWHQMAGAPWNVLDDSGLRIAIFHSNDLLGIATADDEERARLGSKAPDLLRLLKRAERFLSSQPLTNTAKAKRTALRVEVANLIDELSGEG